jgi:hypothetical protein
VVPSLLEFIGKIEGLDLIQKEDVATYRLEFREGA